MTTIKIKLLLWKNLFLLLFCVFQRREWTWSEHKTFSYGVVRSITHQVCPQGMYSEASLIQTSLIWTSLIQTPLIWTSLIQTPLIWTSLIQTPHLDLTYPDPTYLDLTYPDPTYLDLTYPDTCFVTKYDYTSI